MTDTEELDHQAKIIDELRAENARLMTVLMEREPFYFCTCTHSGGAHNIWNRCLLCECRTFCISKNPDLRLLSEQQIEWDAARLINDKDEKVLEAVPDD